ncbi:hypothetical protein DKT68_12310 [Micromonospora acroterricola]|uniref:Uncharacterized protein n=1 Tax=Micromonospora acroterricola TaxID=2202421 RepID=A0A317D5Y3_9ACTN|nr:hypothetical protein [Micromonospora acroterricola]PWR09530.1 hypothetical protein DKT68_12310 [Micromonospora acroterricola]
MTTEGFREVDDDLLADYLGGALDGTPQQAEVARLVDEDPAWAEAYALLAPAVTEVRADLARWAESSPELPPAVAERLAAALAAADPVPTDATADEATRTGAADVEPDAGTATPMVVPAQGGSGPGRRPAGPSPADPGHGTRTGPGRSRRRWARRAAPVAVAAAAVVAVGLGLNQLSMNASDTTGTSALDRPASAPEGAAAAGAVRTTGPSLRSGTNYTPQTLGVSKGDPSPLRAASSGPGEQPGVDAEGGRRPAPNGLNQLARLTDEAALTTCLADVATEHGSGPLVVEVIDYAQFQGEQALVIRFTDATGARWAWVSGPECGVPGSGSDNRYSARVG